MKRICLKSLTLAIYLLYGQTTVAQNTQHDWPLCTGSFDIPPRPIVEEPLEPGESYITADHADLVEGRISHMEGNVEMTRDSQQSRAEIVDYDQSRETVDMQGNVNYWDEAVYLHSDTAFIELNKDAGTFYDVDDYRLLENRGRGQADELYVITDKLTRGKNIDFSTCDPGGSFWNLTDNVWKIWAKKLTLNHEKNRGYATHAILKIKDIPVFYTPFMTFPLNRDRKSGFLIPSYGSSQRNGVELRTPYYWNIAPNMDATITPRLLTDSGVMLMGEYRYLFERGSGIIDVEYLSGDSQFNDQDRNFVSLIHSQYFTSGANLDIRFQNVSDKNYFEDFGSTQSITSITNLSRHAAVSYSRSNWNISARLQDYQIVDPNLPVTSQPYKQLPSINFSAFSEQGKNKPYFNLKSQFKYFFRDDDPDLTNVNASRIVLTPSVSYPLLQNIGYYLTPKAGLRYTQYYLNENIFFDDKSPSSTIPFFSVNSGVFLERDFKILNTKFTHMLEPRIYYLYVPEVDQSLQPIFDTGVLDFSPNSIFQENRFSGGDRFNDANQVTASLTTRLYSNRELGYITIAQVFHAEDRDVFQVETDTLSPVIVEFGTRIIRDLEIKGQYYWDHNRDEFTDPQKLILQAQYRPKSDRVINLAYRKNIDIEQLDFSFAWPFINDWNLVGRWYYDIPENQTLDTFVGIERDSCCWSLRLVGRRFLSGVDTSITVTNQGQGVVSADFDQEFQTGIFLQFELKGLAGSGLKTVDFLTQSIPGYQSSF